MAWDVEPMDHANWRYRVGVSSATQATMSLRMMPLTRYVPPDQFWIFDVHRVSLGREIYLSALICANVGHAAYGLVRYLPSSRIFCVEPAATMQIPSSVLKNLLALARVS